MFNIEESEISIIIHDLIKVIAMLKKVENGTLNDDDKYKLHSCETRLMDIREYILERVIKENNEVDKGNS